MIQQICDTRRFKTKLISPSALKYYKDSAHHVVATVHTNTYTPTHTRGRCRGRMPPLMNGSARNDAASAYANRRKLLKCHRISEPRRLYATILMKSTIVGHGPRK